MNKESNWDIDQTRTLFALAADAKRTGRSLSSVFYKMAETTGRSVNSVRNYYYGQAKTFELVPDIARSLGIKTAQVRRDAFVPFEKEEVKALMEAVLTQKASGRSVRAIIAELAGGDAKAALRLQNKYRSVLRSHRADVEELMAELARRGVAYVDPYVKAQRTDNFARLTQYIASLDENKVGSFLSLIEKLR